MNNFNFHKECLYVQLSPSADIELEKILDKNYCSNWRTRQKCADWHSHLSQDLFNFAKSGYKEPPIDIVDGVKFANLPLSYGIMGYYLYQNIYDEIEYIRIESLNFDLKEAGLVESKSKKDNLEQLAHIITENIILRIKQLV